MGQEQARREQALELMTRFAERSGLTAGSPLQRYLWTDAFAVCNLLGLARATGESRHTELALRLIDQVHHCLGRHRPDDRRAGWISGLTQAEGEAHPTVGGLRIGKTLPERPPDAPIDQELEWERDGQYFHYLTKWMHALDQVTRSTGQPLFNGWAHELARAAQRAFTYTAANGRSKRMFWKLSIDLSRPLVTSMGQHDPLDGLVTYTQLQATGAAEKPRLDDAIVDFVAMIDPNGLATGDPLGIGGLLIDAYRLAQLEQQGGGNLGLMDMILEAALAGLRHFVRQPDLRLPASRRLAFRELGLAIGLASLQWDDWSTAKRAIRAQVDQLVRYTPLRTEIETFWLKPEHRSVDSWIQHANINEVMLATSLQPTGFLLIPPTRVGHHG
jgi:hypothetical protein